jgi:3-hydroxymyristoyl/3-hydroxydecanoyl-(acyl carrier protein) dehydratase
MTSGRWSAILEFVVKPAGAATTSSRWLRPKPVVTQAVVVEAISTPVVEPVVAAAAAEVVDSSVEQLPDAFCVVPIRGTPYEMGLRHGNSQSTEIRTIMERYAAMLGPRLQNIPELDEALAKPTMYFGEQELEELHGIADGAKLPVPAVIAHNLGMYPDYVPGCTQFAFTRERNPGYGMVHAVNEDSPLSLSLPDCIARIVQVRRPVGGIPHVTFSVAGQTGGLNGINAAGLAISSTLLLDRPRRASTAVGKVHPVVVKRLLETAETIEDALAILRGLERAGAWSLCLSHHQTDRLCYLEYDGGTLKVQDGPKAVLTTNHCLLQDPLADVPEHSRHRLNRLQQLLGDGTTGGVTLDMAQQALRDQFDLGRGRLTPHATMNTIRRVDNQISIVMCPELGELYVTPGPRSGTIINQYFKLNVKDLLNHSDETEHIRPEGSSTPSPIVVRTQRAVDATTHAGLPADADRVVQRHVLRMAEAPLTAGQADPKWAGAVLILGQNKVAEALKARLTKEGAQVTLIANTGDLDATIAAVDAAWANGPAPHLFITTARDDAASVASLDGWQTRRQIGVLAPFFVCQKWTQLVQQAKLTGVATLVGVTALGGDFGFGGRVHGIEGGGITGLFKGIRRELPELLVKVIDAPYEEAPATLVDAVWKELADRSGPLETGWIRGTRSIVRAVPQTASSQRRGQKTPHGNWVVTGGARGVTAVVARELGRRFGLTMHLLGSTQQPTIDPSWRNLTEEGLKTLKRTISDQARVAGKNPAQTWKEVERAIEIDRTLQSFRADGVTVHYHACDVSDRAKLGKTLEQIRSQSGPIHGIIHGAGVEAACRFDKKKRESVAATISVKIDAALALLELTQVDPLEWFLGFGSTSGRFGGMGQTDYSMAQDLLCKLCDTVRSRWPDVSAVGLHWPPWADVGMAARPESKIALKSSNLAFMPPLEGAAHVLDELLTEGIEGELLFLDKPDMIDTDGTMPAPALKAEYVRRDALVRASSLIDTIHELSPNGVIGTAYFDPNSDPFLLEHRHQNVPILPAVGGMEAMAETARLLAADGRQVVGVKHMAVHQGLRFHTPRPQRARVVAQVNADGTRCALQADFCDRIGRLVEAHRLQMDATIELAAAYPTLAQFDFGPQPTDWTTHKYVADWRTMDYPEEARVYHGYPFQALKDYAIVDQGIWAHMVVPEPAQIAGRRPVEGWLLPSSTLDASLLACDLMLWKTLRISTLPKGFDHIRFARPLVPGETLTLRVWLKGRGERSFNADLVYVDAAGKTVVQIDGFEMIEVKTGISTTAPEAPQPTPAPTQPTPAPTQPTPAPQAAAPVKAAVPVAAKAPVTVAGPAPAPVVAKPAAPRVNGSAPAAPAPAPLPLASRNGAYGTTTKPVVTSPALVAPAPVTAVAAPKPATSQTISAEHVAELPLIDRAQWVNADELVAELLFHPTQDPFLQQHTFSKKPLLPAVIGLESMIEAAWLTNPQLQLEAVREFQVFQPFKFRDDKPQSAKVVVKREGTAWRCTLLNTNGKEVVNQSALIEFSPQADKVLIPSLDQPPFPYSPMNYAEGDKAQLIHGPLFRCLKGLCLQRDGGWGKVTAAAANNLAGTRQGTRWFIPAATLDSCLVAAGVDLFILMNKRVEVPHRMEEVRILRLPNPNEACVVRLIYRGHTDRHTTYDMILYGADKTPLVMVKGYQGIRTSKEADSSLWIPEAAEDRFSSK